MLCDHFACCCLQNVCAYATALWVTCCKPCVYFQVVKLHNSLVSVSRYERALLVCPQTCYHFNNTCCWPSWYMSEPCVLPFFHIILVTNLIQLPQFAVVILTVCALPGYLRHEKSGWWHHLVAHSSSRQTLSYCCSDQAYFTSLLV